MEYASDAFLYLLAYISLGFWSFAVGAALYALIDRRLPDTLDSSYVRASFRDTVSWELATIIVAFPIFFFVSRTIARGLARSPERAESGVRKWLTYVALIVTAVVMLGDGIWFLNAFLRGELTTRFVLDALVLLAIAGSIFSYYLLSIRAEGGATARDRAFAGIAVGAVALVLVLGFGNIGTPARARQEAADRHRIDDLRAIAASIHSHRQAHPTDPLPATFAGVAPSAPRVDAQSGRPYAYRRIDAGHYELCAVFEAADDGSGTATYYPNRDRQFAHGVGRKCFTFDSASD